MPSYETGDLVKALRIRKQWTHHDLLQQDIYSERNLSRIENKHQSPRPKTFRSLMESLNLPVDAFFCPFLENQSVELIQIREAFLFYLIYTNEFPLIVNILEGLINKMENTGCFSSGINKQFLFSCKAVLNEMQESDAHETHRLIDEGLKITFPEYDENNIDNYILVLEETALIHTKALSYKRTGNLILAISILEQIITGLKKVPQDNRVKERMLLPVLLSLAQCYFESGNYRKAFLVCRRGYRITIKRNYGFYAPDLAFLMSRCLNVMWKDDVIVISLIKQAYFGYTLQRRYTLAHEVIDYAKNDMGFMFETYGVENFSFEIPEPVFSNGQSIKCDNIGELIASFRYETGLTLDELSSGICSHSNLAKIEYGKIQGSIYHLEAIMQRLGRSIDRYFNTFLSQEDFTDKQIRDEVSLMLANCQLDKAEELIIDLSKKKGYSNGVNKQFVDLAMSEICFKREGYNLKNIDSLKAVLSFDVTDLYFGVVARTRMTHNEITAVNQIAINLCESGNMTVGLRLFCDLKESMDRYIVDENEKIRMYIAVLYNYSKFLGQSGFYEEALNMIDKGENLCIKHGRLELLPRFALNRACDVMETISKEESLPYFVQAYYGSMITGRLDYAVAIEKYVLDLFGFSFV